MTIWIDAQLSPILADWLAAQFEIEAKHLRGLSLIRASDPQIFDAAKKAKAVILTKNRDFVDLVRHRGAPPQIIWITSGNTSNHEMMRIFRATLQKALELVAAGEAVVEIKG